METTAPPVIDLPIIGTTLSQYNASIGVTCAFLAFSWIIVVARLWTRLWVIRMAGWDDWFAVLSLVRTTRMRMRKRRNVSMLISN